MSDYVLAEYGSGGGGAHVQEGVALGLVPPILLVRGIYDDMPGDNRGTYGWLEGLEGRWWLPNWPPADQTDWTLARIVFVRAAVRADGEIEGGSIAASFGLSTGAYSAPTEPICKRAAWRSMFGAGGGGITVLAPWWNPIWEIGDWWRNMAWGPSSLALGDADPPDGILPRILEVVAAAWPAQERGGLLPQGAQLDILCAAVALDMGGDPEQRDYALTCFVATQCIAPIS